MLLYHGTTVQRMKDIMESKCLLTNCSRFFTKDLNGMGATTQGYVYFSNEPTFALYYANSHSLVDKSEKLYLIRIDLPIEKLEPDWDEIQHQHVPEWKRVSYKDDLQCSLLDVKSCRVPFDIDFAKISIEYCVVDKSCVNIAEIIQNAGRDYKFVVENYTPAQESFLSALLWKCIV